MTKTTRARYTLEFKQEAVRLVESGQRPAAVARTLGLIEQTLFNWVKASRRGQLDVPPVLSSGLIWSPIPQTKEIGREEAVFRRTDHRFPA